MITKIHDQLKSNNIQLPLCIKLIGYLKRLGNTFYNCLITK